MPAFTPTYSPHERVEGADGGVADGSDGCGGWWRNRRGVGSRVPSDEAPSMGNSPPVASDAGSALVVQGLRTRPTSAVPVILPLIPLVAPLVPLPSVTSVDVVTPRVTIQRREVAERSKRANPPVPPAVMSHFVWSSLKEPGRGLKVIKLLFLEL